MYSRLRFRVRDIFWFVVVASITLAWYVDHHNLAIEGQTLKWHFHVLAGFFEAETGKNVQLSESALYIVHDSHAEEHRCPLSSRPFWGK